MCMRAHARPCVRVCIFVHEAQGEGRLQIFTQPPGRVLQSLMAGGFIFEEAPAFKNYLQEFVNKLTKKHKYAVKALNLDASPWLEWSRPRTE